MNAFFRHSALRLWLTALAGGCLCLFALPLWQQIFGLRWLVFPVIVMLSACFGAVGWCMNRIGSALAIRQVNEATVWERAGMTREARSAFQRSAAFFDSFWLSPFYRRSKTRWLSGTLARFYLSQSAETPSARALVASYLQRFPDDEVVAENWLESLILKEQCSEFEHESVNRIGQSLSRHKAIQYLLMQFYLANGRIDFEAQQTYRRVWKNQQALDKGLLLALARLLRQESIINPWALQVYLKAYQSGDADALEGIAAGLNLMPFGEESRKDLEAARKIVSGLDTEKVRLLAVTFKPVQTAPERRPPKQAFSRRAGLSLDVLKSAGTLPGIALRWLRSVFAGGKKLGHSLAAKRAIITMGISGAVALALYLGLSGRPADRTPEPEPPITKVAEEKPVVHDPFTIQVAAYLKSQDAQRFVDQLAGRKLEAFLTKATSANRTWYQVKVSHFPTREAARQYGQNLKANGVIDDFYVANNEPR